MIASLMRSPRAILQTVVASVTALLMVVTVVDVLGRYLLSKPLPGADEITRFALAIMVFGALPFARNAGGHVRVDILTNMARGAALRVLEGLALVASTTGLAFFAWRLLLVGKDLATYNDNTAILGLPLGPLAWLLAALALVGALSEAGLLCELFRRERT